MDFVKIFNEQFSKAFDCGSPSYKAKVDLGQNRYCEFNLVDIHGNPITKDTTIQNGQVSIQFGNKTGSDSEFLTDKHGTIARIDNMHVDEAGQRYIDAHSGDKRFDNWAYAGSFGTLYLAGSVALNEELQHLIKRKS